MDRESEPSDGDLKRISILDRCRRLQPRRVKVPAGTAGPRQEDFGKFSFQAFPEALEIDPVELQDLQPPLFTGYDTDKAPGYTCLFGQQLDEGTVGGSVNRWRSETHHQGIPFPAFHFVSGCPGFDLDTDPCRSLIHLPTSQGASKSTMRVGKDWEESSRGVSSKLCIPGLRAKGVTHSNI